MGPISPLTTHQPKIADFGLAKRLDGAAGQTTTGAILGTPAYMAPEQAAGRARDVGPATDIWALGAILYEMLTGRPPFQGETPLSTMDQVRSLEPVPPTRLHPKVPRDLETVCLKCLQKEPHKRYESAEALADDLGRFRSGEPIRARPTPAWERALKWARRRPAVAALLGVSGLVVLIVGVIVAEANARLVRERNFAEEKRKEAETSSAEAQKQRQRAVEHLRQARKAVDEMLRQLGHERLASVPQLEKVRRELLAEAVRFYQDFTRQDDDDPELRYEAGRAFRMLGHVQFRLQESAPAEQSYRSAIELFTRLVADAPDDRHYRHELGNSHNNLGVLLIDLRRLPEAETELRRAAELKEKLIADFPDQPEYRRSLAVNHDGLGRLLARMKRPRDAEEALRAAVDLLGPLATAHPDDEEYAARLANSTLNLGVFLARQRRFDEAESPFRQVAAIRARQVERFPVEPSYRNNLALACDNLGQLMKDLRRPEEVEGHYRKAADIWQQLVEDFPRVPAYRVLLAGMLRELALPRLKADSGEARRLLERGIAVLRPTLATEPGNSTVRERLRDLISSLADALLQLGDHAEAARAAAELPPLSPDRWQERLSAGRFLARCASLAEKDAQLPDRQRRELHRTYADRAVVFLREAVARGYRDLDSLKNDPHLEVLRSRGDFQELLRDLAEGGKATK